MRTPGQSIEGNVHLSTRRRRRQRPPGGLIDQIKFAKVQICSLFAFLLLALSDTQAKRAGMLPVKGLRDPGLDAFRFGIIDNHPHPGGRLQNSPVTAEQLKPGDKTKH